MWRFNFADENDFATLLQAHKDKLEFYCRKLESLSFDGHFEYRFQSLSGSNQFCVFVEDESTCQEIEDVSPEYANPICYIDQVNKNEKTVSILFFVFNLKTISRNLSIIYDPEIKTSDELNEFLFPISKDLKIAVISQTQDGIIRLCRDKYYLQINQMPREGGGVKFLCQGIRPDKDISISLLQVLIGKIQFIDKNGFTEEMRQEQEEIVQFRANAEKYNQVWQKYEEEEQIELQQRSAIIGIIHYDACEPKSRGEWKFYLSREEDYRRLDDERKNGSIELTQANTRSHSWHGTVEEMYISGDDYCLIVSSLDLDDFSVPSDSGGLCLDMYAQDVRAKRRKNARETLSGMFAEKRKIVHGLRQILTEKEWKAKIPNKQESIPDQILNMFPATFNDSQMEALIIAYNTPDFAVIQGPPGTGKTHVISALCQWLGKDLSQTNKTLLSSFQHEAVDNLAMRCRIFDIPVQRYSTSSSQAAEDTFAIWCDELKDRLSQKEDEYKCNPVFAAMYEAEKWFNYLENRHPSITNRILVLKQVLGLIRDHVTSSTFEEGTTLLEKWQGIISKSDYPKRFFRFLYGLKCTEESFEDGGVDSLCHFLELLNDMKGSNPVPQNLMDSMAQIVQKGSHVEKQDLVNLEAIKNNLLDQCINYEVLSQEKHVDSAKMSLFIQHARSELDERCRNQANQIDNIFFQYAHEVNNDPLRFRYACKKYSSAIAATTGQSTGQGMQRMLENACFENVIIDEAARATPMDLLIPMTQATKKIVLVGDGKQLPHLVEENKIRNVVAKLKANQEETQVTSALKETLFVRFQNAVQQQFLRDNFPRYIMLDTQYRMRPALGNLLSEAFYEGKLKNGKDDSQFPDIVPYGAKPAIWYDIPVEKGEAEQDHVTKSWFRQCEADAISSEAIKILDLNPDVSLGIITFYNAQVNSICTALRQKNVFEDDACSILSSKYEKRIVKIGSVDSFQGKEFDVVLLSIVRATTKADPKEKTYLSCRGRFGHLLSPGRVCVALSRQKSLLVVFGAASMFSYSIPETGLIGFEKLKELCRSNNDLVQ